MKAPNRHWLYYQIGIDEVLVLNAIHCGFHRVINFLATNGNEDRKVSSYRINFPCCCCLCCWFFSWICRKFQEFGFLKTLWCPIAMGVILSLSFEIFWCPLPRSSCSSWWHVIFRLLLCQSVQISISTVLNFGFSWTFCFRYKNVKFKPLTCK